MGAIESLQLNGHNWGKYQEARLLQKTLDMYLQQYLRPEIQIMLEQKSCYNIHTTSVSYILYWTRSKAATEPSDMVLGLLGIFNALDIDSFIPDYMEFVEEVYRQAAIMAVSYDRNLDILFEAATDNRRTGLNSWVLDWSDIGYKSTDMHGAITNTHFCASGPANPMYHFSAVRNHLHLPDKLLDTVFYSAETMNMRCINEIDAILRTLCGSVQVPAGNDMARPLNTVRELHGAFQIMCAWANVSTWYASYPAPGEMLRTALRRTLLYDFLEANGTAGLDTVFESLYHVMITIDAGLGILAWGGLTSTAWEEARTMDILTTIEMCIPSR